MAKDINISIPGPREFVIQVALHLLPAGDRRWPSGLRFRRGVGVLSGTVDDGAGVCEEVSAAGIMNDRIESICLIIGGSGCCICGHRGGLDPSAGDFFLCHLTCPFFQGKKNCFCPFFQGRLAIICPKFQPASPEGADDTPQRPLWTGPLAPSDGQSPAARPAGVILPVAIRLIIITPHPAYSP